MASSLRAPRPGADAEQQPPLGAGAQEPQNPALLVEVSDEEFTDVADSRSSSSSSEEEEEEEGGEGGHEGAAVHSAAGGAALRAAAAAAVAAAAAAAAAAGGPEDDWPALLAAAAAHLQGRKFDKAVNQLSDALRRSSAAGGTGACPAARQRHQSLLLARSGAYAAMSQQLRTIPAAQSESRAIFAPDPCQLAALGLRDAEAALAMQPDCAEAQLQKGSCLFLLERYEQAASALRTGLQEQPTHEGLQQRLQEVQAALAGGDSGAAGGGAAAAAMAEAPWAGRRLQASDDAECILCMKLLFEPVSTPCGHTFCKPCFSRAMDHSSKCPMCRTVLHVGRELAVTITLKNLLEKSFPEEYAQRRQEEGEAAAAAPASDAPLPLFVMSLLLPGEKMALNIFEPRYRLMVRRCMEGNRLFGMATVNRQHELCEIATEAEIKECQPLPDGRFYLEVLGRRRFRPAQTWEQDGYRVAQPEYVTDSAPPADTPESAALQQEAAEVEALADSWVDRLRALAQTRRGVAELLHRAGDKPAVAGPEALSFWVANLICPVLDESSLKLQFLSTRCTLERLRSERQVLQQLSSVQHSQGCSLM